MTKTKTVVVWDEWHQPKRVAELPKPKRFFTKAGAQSYANKLNSEVSDGKGSGWQRVDYVVQLSGMPYRKYEVVSRGSRR